MRVICSVSDSTPTKFLDVFEDGDEWVKVVGCEGCAWEDMQKCCGNCPHLMVERGCDFQFEERNVSNKPFRCVVLPAPDVCHSYCQQEFLCIQGSKVGLTRRVRDKRDVFRY